MSRILISNRLKRDFAMVPNSLWASDLPFAAKGVACYLLSLHHGATPYVAEMEAALGLGRDARRKAFAALESFGFLKWQVERNARNAIIAKTLVLDPEAFDRATEIQADGELSRAPEIPAGGISVPASTDFRPCRDGISGDTIKQNKIRRASLARKAVAKGDVRRPVRAFTGHATQKPAAFSEREALELQLFSRECSSFGYTEARSRAAARSAASSAAFSPSPAGDCLGNKKGAGRGIAS